MFAVLINYAASIVWEDEGGPLLLPEERTAISHFRGDDLPIN